jgi:hypothetical protein
MLNREIELKMIDDAMKQFPTEFKLRAYPSMLFRIERNDSYYSEMEGAILLYVHIKNGEDWRAFTKGTVNELKKEITK